MVEAVSTGALVVILVNLAWFVPFVVIMIGRARAQSRRRDHRRRLLQTGELAPAVILEVTETGPWYSGVPHLSFKLRVEPREGPPFEATALGFFRQLDFARLQPGGRVEVRFDPSDRAQVAVEGDKLA